MGEGTGNTGLRVFGVQCDWGGAEPVKGGGWRQEEESMQNEPELRSRDQVPSPVNQLSFL